MERTLDCMFCRMYDSREKLLRTRCLTVAGLALLAVIAIDILIWRPIHTGAALAFLVSPTILLLGNLVLASCEARWDVQSYNATLAMNR